MNEKLEIARQILHENEVCLKRSLEVTDALERKAGLLFSVFFTATLILLSLVMKFAFQDSESSTLYFSLLVLSLLPSVCCLGMILAVPRHIFLPNNPKSLLAAFSSKKEEGEEGFDACQLLRDMGEDYQKAINSSIKTNDWKNLFLYWGVFMGVMFPLLVLFQFVSGLVSWNQFIAIGGGILFFTAAGIVFLLCFLSYAFPYVKKAIIKIKNKMTRSLTPE